MKSENERNRLIQGGMDDKVCLSESERVRLSIRHICLPGSSE